MEKNVLSQLLIAIANYGNTGGHFVYLQSVLTNEGEEWTLEALYLHVSVSFKSIRLWLFCHI